MTPAEVLAVMKDDGSSASLHRAEAHGLARATEALHRSWAAHDAVSALVAERGALRAEVEALRAAYHKARNAAAGFSNYCPESANSRRCERDLDEAERMFRAIDTARKEPTS